MLYFCSTFFILISIPFIKQTNPFIVPATDGKLIEEYVGLAGNGETSHSIAHMMAPAGWSEPFRNPAFDEYTLVSLVRNNLRYTGNWY